MLSVYSWITIALWAFCFAWLAGHARTAGQNVQFYGQTPWITRAFKAIALSCMFAVLYFPHWFGLPVRRNAPGDILGITGTVFGATGVLLIVLSRRALGQNWSDLVLLKQNHELVRKGPYTLVRHPLYSGMILGLLGSAMTVGSRAGYGIATACFIGLFAKSRREEALLTRQFLAYEVYRRQVRAFIPHVF